MSKKDFRDEVSPNRDELIIDGEDLKATILDAEWDPIQCKFNGDGCVTIDTKDLTYICLEPENLESLMELIFEAEIYLKQKNDKRKRESNRTD